VRNCEASNHHRPALCQLDAGGSAGSCCPADGDGCDTRDEVLIAEATRAPEIGPDCSLSGGKWFSYYDKQSTTDPSTFDIDHVVPLAEAWDSGARAWTASTRKRYANDLRDPRTLVAVSAHANRSKSDQDPAEWMPTYHQCRYVKQWVAVKIRWHLTANRAEKRFLVSKATSCPRTRVKVTRARVAKRTGGRNAAGLRITKIVYDPAGPDTESHVNRELVVVKNTTAKTMTLAGWKLQDAAQTTYTLPGRKLTAGATTKVHSGSGTNTAKNLYANWGYRWNNTGDTAYLVNPAGAIKQTASYPGGKPGYATF
jgi:Lamin Tail Domain/Protein of unknown function (DUF1524)